MKKTIPHLTLKKIKILLFNGLIMIGLMILATFLALLARHIGFSESNIIMIFLLGVFLVSFKTNGFWLGVIASIVGVLSFNYFFTEPRFTFAVHDPGYLITFPVMLVVSLITSTLTSRIQYQAELSLTREQRTDTLFQISRSFLRTRGTRELVSLSLAHLSRLYNRKVQFYLVRCGQEIAEPFMQSDHRNEDNNFSGGNEQAVVQWVVMNQKEAGKGTDIFSEAQAFYLPVKGQEELLGIIGIEGELELEQRSFFANVIAQIALALDRERLAEEQELSKVEIEKETIRSNLIRSISHDLRTPLTGIAGASSTLLENYNSLNHDVIRKLLLDINQDSEWLIRLVENLLSLTRLDEERINLCKNFEAIEEIVDEAIRLVSKRAVNHRITLDIPDKLILVPMDGNLIVQVIINLVDNAVKYTPKGSEILVKVYEDSEKVYFEVADNGPGIPVEAIPHIFDRFFTTNTETSDARRGIGLGLAICKSIVKTHGGFIEAVNKPEGGAIFRFSLPYVAQDPFGGDYIEEQ